MSFTEFKSALRRPITTMVGITAVTETGDVKVTAAGVVDANCEACKMMSETIKLARSTVSLKVRPRVLCVRSSPNESSFGATVSAVKVET